MKSLAFAAVAASALVAFAAPASATTVVNTYDNGWYSAAGNHSPSNTNTVTGYCCDAREYRSFYAFDLSSLAGQTVSSATITFVANNGDYVSPDGSETLGLFDVSTSVSALIAGGETETGVFDDLGTGASYGSTEVSASDLMPEVSITLTAAALSDLNALLGGSEFDFAIGAALLSLVGDMEIEQALWSTSGAMPAASLSLETGPAAAVPLPAAAPLLVAGLGALGLVRRRRARSGPAA